MLTTEFTPILSKTVTIPSSGFVNTSVYVLVTNATPDEPRTVTFFLEIGPFQSVHKTMNLSASASKLTIFPVELPPGDYTLTVQANADKDERVSVESVTASVR